MRLLAALPCESPAAWPCDAWGIATPPLEYACACGSGSGSGGGGEAAPPCGAGPRTELADAIAAGARTVLLVPGVAFDVRGGRLGHGKGYYDGALARLRATAAAAGAPPPLAAALAFDEQLLPPEEALPAEPHDERVDWIVTPSAILQCCAAPTSGNL